MEKLIELLNEYDGTPTEWKQIGDKIYFDGLGGNSELHELVIISKYYGFIQWLVDNDKIDLENLQCVFSGNINKWKTLMEETDGYERYEGTEYEATESLLMLLAIQDDPINFLISILR